jgi:hypothetical protein
MPLSFLDRKTPTGMMGVFCSPVYNSGSLKKSTAGVEGAVVSTVTSGALAVVFATPAPT